MKVHIQSTCCEFPLAVSDSKFHSSPLSSQALPTAKTESVWTRAHFTYWRKNCKNGLQGSALLPHCTRISQWQKKWHLNIFFINSGQFIPLRPLLEVVSKEVIYCCFTVGVMGLFNCCAEQGFAAVLVNKLVSGELLQETEPLSLVDHPVDVLSFFAKFFCSVLFTRITFNALEEE